MVNRSTETTRQQRLIRVFVSSTFRDMFQEREELVKRVFPQLRKLCESRGVTLVEVDLRWGITDEQSAEGQVLPICLAEIDNSRPYFIGILGERYGWVPDEIPPELVEEMPWLADYGDRSVTEIEILHGVLNNPDLATCAFFYFRDPTFLPPGADGVDFEERDEASRKKLNDLKQRLRGSGFPVLEGYGDPRALGDAVMEDLGRAIEQLFPEEEVLDPLDIEADAHLVYAASRTGVYVGRQAYYDRLNQHVHSDDPPLVIVGEAGAGKSALMANWTAHFKAELAPGDEDTLLIHFVGASPSSTDWEAMLRHIMGELQRRYGFGQEIPQDPNALKSAFTNVLGMASARGRVVLILDALDKLEDRDGAPDLLWLPPELPVNVRLIASTLPGRPLEAAQARGWGVLQVELLALDERRQLIGDYLAQHRKTLRSEDAEKIASADQSSNPLFLRTLLEELRIFGVHEQLAARIDHYLTASTIDGLFAKVLQRYEEDYEGDRPGLVGEAMSLLWAARHGLSEAELLSILGSDGELLPRAIWSPLYLAAEQSLMSRAGLLSFSHDYFGQAVKARYLDDPAAQTAIHLRLAGYFGAQERGPRQVAELPWQLAQAASWEELAGLLGDKAFLLAVIQANYYDARGYWTAIEENSPLRMADTYREAIANPTSDPSLTHTVGALLFDAGHLDEAASVWRGLMTTSDSPVFGTLLGSTGIHPAETFIRMGEILHNQGEFQEALTMFREAERYAREYVSQDLSQAGTLQRQRLIAASLGYQAQPLQALGDVEGALSLTEQAEQIYQEIGVMDGVAGAYKQRAILLELRGELQEAERLYKEAERIFRETNNAQELMAVLGDRAVLLSQRGNAEEALALHREEERLARQMGFKLILLVSLTNQAKVLSGRGEPESAAALLEEAEEIAREVDVPGRLAWILLNKSDLMMAQGNQSAAQILLGEVELIARTLSDRMLMALLLDRRAAILFEQGNLHGAMTCYKEEEQIAEEFGNKEELIMAIVAQTYLAEEMFLRGQLSFQNMDDQMRVLERDKRIQELYGELGLANPAELLRQAQTGQSPQAARLYVRFARLQTQMWNLREKLSPVGRIIRMEEQAAELREQGKLDAALRVLEEQEHLIEKMSYLIWLGSFITNARSKLHQLRDEIRMAQGKEPAGVAELVMPSQAVSPHDGLVLGSIQQLIQEGMALANSQDYVGALKKLEEAEQLARQLRNATAMMVVLLQKGIVIRNSGDKAGADPIFAEGLEIVEAIEQHWRERGDLAQVSASLFSKFQYMYNRPPTPETVGELPKIVEERLVVARQSGDPAQIAHALLMTAPGLAIPPEERLARVNEALQIATEHGLTDLAEQARRQIGLLNMFKPPAT
jgi:nephrocystin-3